MKKTNFTLAWPLQCVRLGYLFLLPILLLCFTHNVAAQCTLACNGANISVDSDCSANLTMDMFVNGEMTSCEGTTTFEIIIQDHHSFEILFQEELPENGAIVWPDAGNYIGEQVKVIIKEVLEGNVPENSCWNYSLIEDKFPPIIECDDVEAEVSCCGEFDFLPVIIDECSGVLDTTIISERTIPNDCNFSGVDDEDLAIVKWIERVIIATDKSGNTSDPCTLTIAIHRLNEDLTIGSGKLDLGEGLHWPDSLTVMMGNAVDCALVGNNLYEEGFFEDEDEDGVPDASPGGAGVPWLDKNDNWTFDENSDDTYLHPLDSGEEGVEELVKYCGIGVSYQDIDLGTIKCVRKVMRMWTIREWFCGEENTCTYTQLIEIVDDEGPELEVPHDFNATTNGYTCEAYIEIPEATAYDVCSEVARIDLRITNFENSGDLHESEGDPVAFFSDWKGGKVHLPEGLNKIEYLAYDECHNLTIGYTIIDVKDSTPPVAICDEHTVVSLTNEGRTTMPARVLDDGSYDDCKLKKFVAKRMVPGCQCEDHYPKFDGFYFLGEYEDHYYYVSHDSFPGYKAHQISEALGGYSAVIGDEDEDEWIYDAVQGKLGDTDYWIGLSDHLHEGEFEWQNGDPFNNSSYDNFDGGQPDNDVPGQDYVLVTSDEGGDWYDEAGYMEHRFVLEIEDPCGWSEYLDFCCDDLGVSQMIQFRAIDKWGNYNDCMVEVEVQDKVPPFLICPPDLTVACEFDFADLNVFGKVVGSQAEREAIHIPLDYLYGADTEEGIIHPGDDAWPPQLWDGYAADNCMLIIEEDPPTDERDQCGFGTLIRNFKAYTAGGQDTSRCWQFITFESYNHFTFDNIIWPADTLITDCQVLSDTKTSLSPDVYGKPIFPGEDECDLVGTNFEDHVFYFNDSDGVSCFKLIRKWHIIDWCEVNHNRTYQTSTEYEQLEYPQVIKVVNTVDPIFDGGCQDRIPFCVVEPDCNAQRISH